MSYHPPKDPRKPWEWCPRCERWFEIHRGEYARSPVPVTPGYCYHDVNELPLTEEEVEAASRPAPRIAAAFRVWSRFEGNGDQP